MSAVFSASKFPTVSFCAALLLCAAIYWPGLHGPFAFDDYNNIVDNKSLVFTGDLRVSLREAAFAGSAGPLKRPIAMLSFAVNRELSGMDPFWFKLTNLVIHLLNGALVYVLIRSVLTLRKTITSANEGNPSAIAAAVAAVWLLHPAQLTSVLYVVQRMTSLSATFVFAGLITYVAARSRLLAGRRTNALLFVGVPFWGLLSCLTKENGVLLFLFAFVLEACLFDFHVTGSKSRVTLRAFFVVFVGLPALALLAFFVLNPGWLLNPNPSRPFTVLERLMTESRALFLYVEILFVPIMGSLALYYDDFAISRGLFDPPTTAVAIAAVVIGLIMAVVMRRRLPWFAFGTLWFIAAHLIESTVVMLELVHLHRNYVAYIGPILAAVILIWRGLAIEGGRLRLPLALGVTLVLASVTVQRASQWSHPLEQATFEVHHRPDSPRANYELGRLLYIAAKNQRDETLRQEARRYFERATKLDPVSVNAPIALLIVDGAAHLPESRPAKLALMTRLSTRPLAATEVHFLRSLVDCQRYPECRRPPQDIIDVFGSALSQPLLRKPVKADLLAILGMYYANYLNDLPACIRTMEAAVELVPNDSNHRLNLAHALIAARRLDDAEMMVARAEADDKLGVYASRIKEYRKDLAEFRQGHKDV